MSSFEITVRQNRCVVWKESFDSQIEIGRQDVNLGDPPAISAYTTGNKTRLVIADKLNVALPRLWFQIDHSDDGSIHITNIHQRKSVSLGRDGVTSPATSRSFQHGLTIDISEELSMEVAACYEPNEEAYRSLVSIPPTPGELPAFPSPPKTAKPVVGQSDEIARLLRLTLQVVQQAAGSNAFFEAAAAATIQVVDVDRSVVLLQEGVQGSDQGSAPSTERRAQDGWCTVAESINPHSGRSPGGCVSKSLIDRVVESRTTVIYDPSLASGAFSNAQSLVNTERAVASPIMNRDREVIGVLYADRTTQDNFSKADEISDTEATLIEILAGAVAGGMARCSEERLRTVLSGFFSPKVVTMLATNPELMAGKETELTILFCDIRGFSSAAEVLGAKRTFEWINAVFTKLSQCVIQHDGVVVDYIGDEMLATWGAPGNQPDHAARAIDAAREMLIAIDELSADWDELPQRFAAGIGLNTGIACIGNVGSDQRFKYGPIGDSVNLSSRLQSATKQLGVTCIASEETIRQAGAYCESRRLGAISVVGIDRPVDVYEVPTVPSETWKSLARDYEEAERCFENRNFLDAIIKSKSILERFPDDKPTIDLRVRAQQASDADANGNTDFSAIKTLSKK